MYSKFATPRRWTFLVTGSNPDLLLGPRPRRDSLVKHNIPVKTVLTLLKLEEGAELLGAWANQGGYAWRWWPLDARPHSTVMSPVEKFLIAGKKIKEALENGPTYVHCAAGIHRTGMAAYTYYRVEERQSTAEAYDSVVSHRSVIGTDAKEKLEWLEEQLQSASITMPLVS